jgi:hypothetical protein
MVGGMTDAAVETALWIKLFDIISADRPISFVAASSALDGPFTLAKASAATFARSKP